MLLDCSERNSGILANTFLTLLVVMNSKGNVKVKKTILRFKGAKHVPSSIDGIDIYFYYEIVTVIKEGRKKPKEEADSYRIRVLISGSLAIGWGFGIWRPSEEYTKLMSLLLPYAIEHIKKAFYSGNLLQEEEIRLLDSPAEPEYEIHEYVPINGYEEILEESESLVDITEGPNKTVAAEIVNLRDSINTLVKTKSDERLLEINQERNLNDLYKIPKSKEEFWYSLASLANLVGNINKKCIHDLMEHPKKENGSIKQLEVYLQTLNSNPNDIIIPLKSINHIRQGFPIHTDRTDNYISTLKYFGLDYPITNYPKSWEAILKVYMLALKKLFELLKSNLT